MDEPLRAMSPLSWTTRALALALGLATALALLPAPPASAAVPVVVLDGTGYGHGVGLSQWGAEYLARTGRSTADILGTFYPGASLAEASGPVRVTVRPPGPPVTTLTFPQGGEVRSPLEGEQAPGFPVTVGAGGRVRVTFDGSSYRVDGVATAQGAGGATAYRQDPCLGGLLCPTTTAPAPPTTTPDAPGSTQPPAPGTEPPPDSGAPAPPPASASSSGPVFAVPADGGVTTVDDRGRSYRGFVEATGGSSLRLVNHVGVEDYLRGMAEVPGTWPAAAVQAQTVAARTYALRAMQASGELCDDARCQVYVGRSAETRGQDAAVAATAGTVLAFDGALAAAVYSADAGGVSATTLEGFGTPDGVYPYLRTVHYETDNPLPWNLQVGLADVGARLGYPGTVAGVRISETGPSGRALSLVLEGSAGEAVVNGRDFARALGLRSTRFTATMGTSDAVPLPPPPAEEALQGMPEETAMLAREPARNVAAGRIDTRSTARAVGAELPPALDPRRQRLLTLLAALLAAGLVGAHVPLALAATPGRGRVALGAADRRARWLARWRALRRHHR